MSQLRIETLEKEIKKLKEEIVRLKGLKNYNNHICPKCGKGLISLSSKQIRVCCCSHVEPFVLKKGAKSVLENKIGE